MQTQCPHCRTIFNISADQLKTANGRARCSHCEEVFYALDHISEQGLEDPGQLSGVFSDIADVDGAFTDPGKAGGDGQTETEPYLIDFKQDDSEESTFEFDSYALEQFSSEMADLRDSSFVTHKISSEYVFLSADRNEAPIEPKFSLQELFQDSEFSYEINNETDDSIAIPDDIGLAPVGMEKEQDAEIETEQEGEAKPDIEIDTEEKIEVTREVKPDAAASRKDTPIEPLELPFTVPEDLSDIPPAINEPLPVDDLLSARKTKRRLLIGSLIIITLIILAVAQLTWLGRVHLVQYQEGRQLFQFICRYAGCQLPARKATEKIEIVSRIVEVHPEKENALRILLSITNRAPFPQPYPEIQITLYDIKEALVASRLFQPEEYLGKTYSGLSLQSGENLDVEMELEDPGDEVSGFRFEFF